jgi:hypothetical protein
VRWRTTGRWPATGLGARRCPAAWARRGAGYRDRTIANMNGQVTDGASAGDQDQYGAQSRHAPQSNRSSRRRSSGIGPDPAPPGEPGRTRKLVRRSRGRALNHVRPARRRVRVSAGAEVEHLLPQSSRERGRWSDAGQYRRAQRTATALLAGLAPFDVLRHQISGRRGQRRQPPVPVSKQTVECRAGLPSHPRDQERAEGPLQFAAST